MTQENRPPESPENSLLESKKYVFINWKIKELKYGMTNKFITC